VDSNERIIRLLTTLTSSPESSQGFELPEKQFERHQQKRFKALIELISLQTNSDVQQMLSRVCREVAPSGTINVLELSRVERDQVLRRVEEYGVILLSTFLDARGEESARSNREKYLRERGARDPFLADTNLTGDAYAGKSEMEPDTPPKLDERGNVGR
jgi:hypothetical protein